VAVAPSGLVQDVDVTRVPPRRSGEAISPVQLMKKIEKTFDAYIRPMLQKDGGDLELVDIKERTVYVRMAGACASCVGANATIKLLVERALKEQVDEQIRVIAI
jgi:NifU-like protein